MYIYIFFSSFFSCIERVTLVFAKELLSFFIKLFIDILQFIYRSSQCICYKSRQFIFFRPWLVICTQKKIARKNLVGKRKNRHIGDETIYTYLFYGYSIKMIEKEQKKNFFDHFQFAPDLRDRITVTHGRVRCTFSTGGGQSRLSRASAPPYCPSHALSAAWQSCCCCPHRLRHTCRHVTTCRFGWPPWGRPQSSALFWRW